MIGLNGGLIGVQRSPVASSASGMWTANEQSLLKSANFWPASAFSFRYWRFSEITTNNSLLEISEWRLMNDTSIITGGTWTWSGSNYTQTNSSAMTNNILNARAFQLSTPVAGSYVQYDHGSVVAATAWQYATFFASGSSFVTGLTISGSLNGSTFVPLKTLSGLTRYTTSDNVISPAYALAS